MACESVNIDGNIVNLNVGQVHQNEASNVLGKVGEMQECIETFMQLLDNQLEKIPEHFGEKDELGENVEEYIDELKTTANEDILNKLNTIIGSRETINTNAHTADVNQAISLYRQTNDTGGCSN